MKTRAGSVSAAEVNQSRTIQVAIFARVLRVSAFSFLGLGLATQLWASPANTDNRSIRISEEPSHVL
ncbi:MAG: hypothetical protein QNJ46_16650 [Leptolyngbyaceae cyanobacterium MO_188.B28]|nr:hypothetical protein [Leptolyngbyaceae cyanobacterium MO_188.B28]